MPKLIDTEALFRVTVDLFAERGFDGLTTQEVATRAGINEVTIYRRFGTKAALVEAAIANRLASFDPIKKGDTLAKKSLNDKLKRGVTIGLNDKIAFIKHLFDGKSEDYELRFMEIIERKFDA